ncbi:MAG: hypothetical protein GEV09_26540, partial [Pseudonocardiaceae bacterium]|nr:hypothetical protein [Pseudonocardiaceae bacterium]
MQWTLLLLLLGINLMLWTLAGGLRLASQRLERGSPGAGDRGRLSPADVAVLIAARNEELVIASTI